MTEDTNKEKTAPAPKGPSKEEQERDEARGYRTEQRYGQDYFVAADGYASFNEGYVQEYVKAQRAAQTP